MSVATKLFVKHGYTATSLLEIATRAHVSTLTLYRHFGGKEALFMEVLAARGRGSVSLPPSIRDAESLHDNVMQIARYVCDVSFRRETQDLMRLSIAEKGRFPEFIVHLTQTTFGHFRQVVACMFEELIARGVVPRCDAAASAALFVDLILGTRPLLVYAGCASFQPDEADLEARTAVFILGHFGPAVAKRARSRMRPDPQRPTAAGALLP